MPDEKNYWTQQRADGQWESKREGADRASKVTDTQAEAWKHSKQRAADTKGEALLKGRDGKSASATPTGKTRIRQKGKA